jgi:hypothetical protein
MTITLNYGTSKVVAVHAMIVFKGLHSFLVSILDRDKKVKQSRYRPGVAHRVAGS